MPSIFIVAFNITFHLFRFATFFKKFSISTVSVEMTVNFGRNFVEHCLSKTFYQIKNIYIFFRTFRLSFIKKYLFISFAKILRNTQEQERNIGNKYSYRAST